MNRTPQVKSESGIDLLQRLAIRPKLSGLQPEVFGDNGPQPGDVVEINEKGCSGKNLLVTQWIATCILPLKWRNIFIGGLNVGVVLLSTDHHFSILHFVSILERKLKRILRQTQLEQGQGSALVEEIRQDSLKRLVVFECFSKHQLLFTFCSIKTFILSHPQMSVIFIDSLSAYYWEDRMLSTTPQSLEQYYQALLNNLIEKLRQTNMTIFYTIQRFLRESKEVDNERGENNSSQTFIYSVTFDKSDTQLVVYVDDKRTTTKFSRNVSVSKGEIFFP
jgi:hypothetical protein